MEPAQIWAWFDADLTCQYLPGVPVGRQRLRLPSAPVQRQHPLGAKPLPQRVGYGQCGQFRDKLAVPPHRQPGLHAPLDGLEALHFQPR